MEKIHIGFMKDLKNIEFGELFDIISHSLTAQSIENQLLLVAQKNISPHNKELFRMKNKKLRHPLTQVVQELMQDRTKYLACLRLKVDAGMLSPDTEEHDAAVLLKFWISPYKKGLYPPSFDMQSRMVSNLIDDRLLSPEIQKATYLLHLDKLLETIEELTSKIRASILIRLNERDDYIVKGQDIRKAAYGDLKLFVEVMEVAYKLSCDEVEKENFREISSNLNAELKDFRTKLRIRTTKRKNKKIVLSSLKELIGTQVQKNNLPMIVYDGLIIDPSISTVSNKLNINPSTVSVKGESKINPRAVLNVVKSNSEDSSINIKHKEK